MPEGPSIVILREAAAHFRNHAVRITAGNSSLDLARMQGRRVVSVRSWGKHFLLEFRGFSLRAHLLMFGTWRIDERKPTTARASLTFDNGELNLYTCSLKYIEGPLDDAYDWRADVMSPAWDPRLARRKLKARPDALICDALLDQDIFAGVGNIIKNEVLFRTRVHPAAAIATISPRRLGQVIAQAREYSFDFLAWKKAYELKKHWQVHTKRTCPRCGGPVSKQYLGTTQRRAFFCPVCQLLP
ncbi:DNA-formamidopyrimidine glycosylase family protein [Stenotrophomonas chelatiphaga]|uniref:DNA-formamidopyrimidine glycosylase family protein n=1 Tax=Stenotrophomonas chelatiphaga TaxID=517011 RepID=UPI0028A06D9C|nr:DNA-formamidopyrimidine glycosylase family protein [Stenotrophomonas chelatiphaga]